MLCFPVIYKYLGMCVCMRARFSQNILPFLPIVGTATIWIHIAQLTELVATRFNFNVSCTLCEYF